MTSYLVQSISLRKAAEPQPVPRTRRRSLVFDDDGGGDVVDCVDGEVN